MPQAQCVDALTTEITETCESHKKRPPNVLPNDGSSAEEPQ